MPKSKIDYGKGLIYKIVHQEDYDNKNIYIGSTTNFTERKRRHKIVCNNPNNKGYNNYKYVFIRENEGWDSFNMVLIEHYPCNNKKELESRERYWIEHFKANLNKQIPTRTRKEWKEENNYNHLYYYKNQEKILEQKKQYVIDNKEIIKEKRKLYNKTEKAQTIIKEYRQHNEDKIKEQKQVWYEQNKERILQQKKEEYKELSQIVICDCGCKVGKNKLKRHKQSNKHINLMKN